MFRLFLVCFLLTPAALLAQPPFGSNLIVNGDAETGAGSGSATIVASIPGWTSTGANVLTYASGYGLSNGDILPSNVGKNYFSDGSTSSSLSQTITLSAGATAIDGGSVSFAASGYFGAYATDSDTESMTIAFLDSSSRQLSSFTIGNVTAADREGNSLYMRRQIGPVPVGSRSATVTVNFVKTTGVDNAYCDNLTLVLNAPAPAQSILGTNLIVNGDGELGLPIPSSLSIAPDLPGWVRTADFTTDSYAVGADLEPTSAGPPDRGKLYFYGGPSNLASSAYQDIDVSAAAALTDAGSIKYSLTAWIGGYSDQNDNCTVTAQFMTWSGTVLATVTEGPVSASDRGSVSKLLQSISSGTMPAGTRMVRVQISMNRTDGSDDDGLADSLSLILSNGAGAPTIAANGVVTAAAFGGSTAIAPGTWIEIYGQNLAPDAREWAGSDFLGATAPTTLDNVKVTVGGQSAFVRYISAGQVNVQVPSNAPTGSQPLVVSTANGSSAPYPVTVNVVQPGVLAPSTFIIGGKQYVAALFADGATFALPASSLPGVTSRPAKPGETIIIYGVGFGATSPAIAAGQITAQANSLTAPLQVTFGGAAGTLSYYGLSPNFVGLYQFNVVVPNVANNDLVPLVFTVNGSAIAQTLYISVHN